jgi:hypothetical protein
VGGISHFSDDQPFAKAEARQLFYIFEKMQEVPIAQWFSRVPGVQVVPVPSVLLAFPGQQLGSGGCRIFSPMRRSEVC